MSVESIAYFDDDHVLISFRYYQQAFTQLRTILRFAYSYIYMRLRLLNNDFMMITNEGIRVDLKKMNSCICWFNCTFVFLKLLT